MQTGKLMSDCETCKGTGKAGRKWRSQGRRGPVAQRPCAECEGTGRAGAPEAKERREVSDES